MAYNDVDVVEQTYSGVNVCDSNSKHFTICLTESYVYVEGI